MHFRQELNKLLAKALKEKEIVIDELLEVPPSDALGDYALPCFKFAQTQKKKPQDVATTLAGKITASFIEKIETKGPYVNIFLKKQQLAEHILKEVLEAKENYGKVEATDKTVMVEFSQANTHKAFHVGHIRGTSLGESIARILEHAGKNVVRVNYQGDTGMHVAKWIWCYQTYHIGEPLQEDEAWIANIYVEAIRRLTDDETLQSKVDVINQKLENKEDETLNKVWEKTRTLCLEALENIYQDLDTRFDEYFFESHVEERGKQLAQELVKKKIAEISDEATIINLEKYNKGVWVLLRKDGTVLYSAKDVALAEKKFNEHKLDQSVYVVGKEQELHFYQLFKTLELMKFKEAKKCVYVPVNLVRLPHGKMSSRTGDNILYSTFKQDLITAARIEIKKRSELSDEELDKRALAIAIASMKYTMLSQDINKTIVFNKDEAVQFEGDTGPYLQYTYARAASILRKTTTQGKMDIPKILHAKELSLLKLIGTFPQTVEHAATELAPSTIAHYAHDLAQTFNEFYHNCKVQGSKEETFRLALVQAFVYTLGNALLLLGITPLEEM